VYHFLYFVVLYHCFPSWEERIPLASPELQRPEWHLYYSQIKTDNSIEKFKQLLKFQLEN
jgi:hypothetical protein